MALEQVELRRLLETAIVAARLAGQRAMEEMSYIKVSVKNENELVTQADGICQQIIIDRIKEAYPDHGFLGEEGEQGKLFKQPPRSGDIWWIIDPIDGTNNFAHKVPLFAVSIAAMHQGHPIVGVIFDPANDYMYTAVKDDEAQLNGRHITAGDEDLSEFTSVGLDSHFECKNGVPPWAAEIIKLTRFRNLGTTALQMTYVAHGGLAATIVNTPKLWDIAAGAVIGQSAGALFTNWQGAPIFPIDPATYEGTHIPCVLANQKTHPKLIQMLNT